MTTTPEVLAIRKRIDSIDDQINDLLVQRAVCVMDMRRAKSATDVPIFVPAREQAIIDRVVADHKGLLPDAAVAEIFRQIIANCRKLEQKAEV